MIFVHQILLKSPRPPPLLAVSDLGIAQRIISSIKHRDYLFHICKRSKQLTDFESYKKFRNHLTQHVNELAKRKYYEDQFAQNSRNWKRTWTVINDIFDKSKTSTFLQRLKVDGRVYSSAKLITDALSNSFVSLRHGRFLLLLARLKLLMQIYKYLLPRQVSSIFLSPTTPDKLVTLINELDSEKSCGHDDIPVRVWNWQNSYVHLFYQMF